MALRNTNLLENGPILKQKALKFAESLGDKNFKASTEWLDN